ncbi:MAG: hypothetical protein WC744_02105 [Patescibacteria group bacterium]|jgi:predicted nucleotidyltransferase
MSIKQSILKVIKYFAVFAYQPTSNEIYSFLEYKISRSSFEKELKKLPKYTPPQYSIKRIKNSKKKLENWRFRAYIKLISLFPQIKLVGLSGSISMMNAREEDDIDLFIITAKNRLFTGRLVALALAQLLRLRRNRNSKTQFLSQRGPLHPESEKIAFSSSHKDKVCLNLFFDERDLKVPKFKQTEFVGHEVLQMKPIIVKGDVYRKFLEGNKWVFRLFPNAKNNSEFRIQNSESIHNFKFIILNFGRKIELILKKIQLNSINKHRTTEIITSSQLWFHPDDFERKLKLK